MKTKDRETGSFKSMNLLTHLLTHRHWPPADPLFIWVYLGCLLS